MSRDCWPVGVRPEALREGVLELVHPGRFWSLAALAGNTWRLPKSFAPCLSLGW